MYLLNIIPWSNEGSTNPELKCQVTAYQNGIHSDTEFFSNTVDCIAWAAGNLKHFDKFLIFSDDWKHKIIGKVISDNGKRKIDWKDAPVDIS